MAKIGDLCEIRGELKIEWKIKNFMSLSDEYNTYYDSHTFYFSGTSWELRIYPNGETENKSDGWLGLYIIRKSVGAPVTLHISFSLKKADGNKDHEFNSKPVTIDKRIAKGLDKMLLRSELMERKTELIPSDELTIICTLRNNGQNSVTRKYITISISISIYRERHSKTSELRPTLKRGISPLFGGIRYWM